jgi:NAD(P)-dependent dehydrogenase (short-subunit alcohol dehydrogenase family)
MSDLSGRTTIVVGASRGLGHGIATAFAHEHWRGAGSSALSFVDVG